MKYYWFLKSNCALGQSRLGNKKRNLAENLHYALQQYWRKAYPYDKIHLDGSCKICD